jgi:acyl carrier protein
VPEAASTETLLSDLRREIEAVDPDALLEEFDADSEVAALGLDSMTMMSVIAEIERTYSIRLPNEHLTGLETVGQVIDVVQSQMANPVTSERSGPCQCC